MCEEHRVTGLYLLPYLRQGLFSAATAYTRLAPELLGFTSHLAIGVLQLLIHLAFSQILGIQTQFLMLMQQVPYPLSHLPGPCVIFLKNIHSFQGMCVPWKEQ